MDGTLTYGRQQLEVGTGSCTGPSPAVLQLRLEGVSANAEAPAGLGGTRWLDSSRHCLA